MIDVSCASILSTKFSTVRNYSIYKFLNMIEKTEKRLSADDIEALIIKRAKANALKIGTGAMPSRPIEALFAELETE